MDRRAHYLEVAMDLFTTHGFHGVSIDQVVAVAGGSKATLYRYFPSKEALFEGLITRVAEVTIAAHSIDELADLSVEEGLRAIAHATAHAALSDQATVLFRLAVGECVRFPELARTMFERGPALSYSRLCDFITRRVAAGEVTVDHPQIAAEQFLGGIVGHLQLRRALGQPIADPAQVEARVEAGIRTFLAMYARQ